MFVFNCILHRVLYEAYFIFTAVLIIYKLPIYIICLIMLVVSTCFTEDSPVESAIIIISVRLYKYNFCRFHT